MKKSSKSSMATLYQVVCATFCTIAIVSNIVSAKMTPLPYLKDFIIPVGLFAYPLTFLLSDFVTEIFGAKKAKMMVYIALAMNMLSFCLIQLALVIPTPYREEEAAFHAVLGLSGLRIFSSLTAYIVAQIVDIQLYALIKKWTHSRFLWLRNNGSTCTSQILDTIIIDIIYLYWGLQMPLSEVMPIMLISYAYKATFSILNTPLLYLAVFLVRREWNWPFWKKVGALFKSSSSQPVATQSGGVYESNM